MDLSQKQQQLVDDLEIIPDQHERLAAVVDRGRRVLPLDESERIDANRVRGCVSAVWLVASLRDGRCHFRSDADGPLVRGLVAFLCEFFDGATPDEIIASQANPLVALGLIRHLSPTRQNGLASALATIRTFAARHAGETTNERE